MIATISEQKETTRLWGMLFYSIFWERIDFEDCMRQRGPGKIIFDWTRWYEDKNHIWMNQSGWINFQVPLTGWQENDDPLPCTWILSIFRVSGLHTLTNLFYIIKWTSDFKKNSPFLYWCYIFCSKKIVCVGRNYAKHVKELGKSAKTNLIWSAIGYTNRTRK